MRTYKLKEKIKIGSYISRLERKVEKFEEQLYLMKKENLHLKMKLDDIKRAIK